LSWTGLLRGVSIDSDCSDCSGGPCVRIAPFFASLPSLYPHVVFIKVDTDKLRSLPMSYGVTAFPTFSFIKSGKVVDQFAGADDSKLEEYVKKYAPTASKPKEIPSPYKNFPLKENELVKYSSAKFDVIEAKMVEFNEMELSTCKLDSVEIKLVQDTIAILADNLSYHKSTLDSQLVGILKKTLDWKQDHLPPVLNLYRLLVLHPDAVKLFNLKGNRIMTRSTHIL